MDDAGPCDHDSSSSSNADDEAGKPVDPYAAPLAPEQLDNPPINGPPSLLAWGALSLLSLAYVHQSCNAFALPSMLPAISSELGLVDMQGALLTTGYSYLYAITMLPVGLLADRVDRPKLLALGVGAWSAFTLVASHARTFGELLAARIFFAGAVAVQNPVSFALIPELFPRNKSAALALYNCAIYVGRAMSFGAVLAAEKLANQRPGLSGMAAASLLTPLEGGSSVIYVPVDQVDLSLVSILYMQGDYAAVVPHFRYAATPAEGAAELAAVVDPAVAPWREVLMWVAAPGLIIALALVAALPEPRVAREKMAAAEAAAAAAVLAPGLPTTAPGEAPGALVGGAAATSGAAPVAAKGAHVAHHTGGDGTAVMGDDAGARVGADASGDDTGGGGSALGTMLSLLRNPRFTYTTLGASFNDVGSYVLMAFQATFYERVYHLDASSYAPILAVVLPLGGIVGGVGGGYIADGAAATGRRAWMTVGATAAAAPVMLASLLAGDSTMSFAALLVGFCLSEAWRAPAANMARGCAPPDAGSSTVSLYLCIRNLVGGLGPLGVALLAQQLDGDLRSAMLLVPAAYIMSAVMFGLAEAEFSAEQRAAAAALVLEDPPSSSAGPTSAGGGAGGMSTEPLPSVDTSELEPVRISSGQRGG